ncbi:ATP-binding protein [Geotalea uraniireducens]|uniref:ATPase (AAA+ superfamily)-like protein n=1 Tax=Geotalea uraniireducens (strain Rf4) TaxID=351605 RepID=A5G791_GEOUR|nr:ATP-binding protein [Geotalea uraniireducens]ABQ27659.1 ATPase (AAA+ superfamily)-like protein [Geotalea uraniireducens Rf4]
MNSIKRSILDTVISRLQHEQIVALTGARQTGKTTLCEVQLPKLLNLPFTYISFDDPDERLRFQRSAVSILESITTPLVVLDEVQKIPQLFDPLKLVVDRECKKPVAERKRFVMTGSSQLLMMKNIQETLAGRVALCQMYPFSLHELTSDGEPPFLSRIWRDHAVSRQDVERLQLASPQRLRTLRKVRDEHQLWGGYPPVWQRTGDTARLNWLKDYRKTYLERDIADVGQVANIDTFALAQKLLCSRTANLLSISEVARGLGVAVNTLKRYLELLTMSFQCYLLSPWHENVGKRLIKSPKLYFPDMGVNRAVLGELSVSRGAAYESWVCAELLKWKQLQPLEPELYFYRTAAGLEVDFLLADERGIIPIEAKSSERVTSTDARSVEMFLAEHPKAAHVGLVVYPGNEIVELRKNVWGVPDWYLFGAL